MSDILIYLLEKYPKADKHYSGNQSTDFWNRINATKDVDLYRKACELQSLEGEVLNTLKSKQK